MSNLPLSYTIQAVVHHSGSLDFGHYITDAKGPHNLWERIDDDSVTPSTVEKALNRSPSACEREDEDETGDPWTPYLLFYIKRKNWESLEEHTPDSTEEVQGQKPTFKVRFASEQPMKSVENIVKWASVNETVEGQGQEPNPNFNVLVQAAQQMVEEGTLNGVLVRGQEPDLKRTSPMQNEESIAGVKKSKPNPPEQAEGNGGKGCKCLRKKANAKKNRKKRKSRR